MSFRILERIVSRCGQEAGPNERCVRSLFKEMTMVRGNGETTRQMEAAPKGAVFVWCNAKTDYAVLLARKIGREDLQIQTPEWFEDRWRGIELTGVVVDHAARLNDRQWYGYQGALTRVRSNAPANAPASTGD